MKDVKIGNSKVVMYNDIDELPIKNYNMFNEYGLLENHIGSDLSGTEMHFQNLDKLLAHNKVKEAIQERKNLHQNFWNIFQHTSFPSLQFACFIYSINGVRIFDYSQENLKKIIEDLSDKGLLKGFIDKIVDGLKKKS